MKFIQSFNTALAGLNVHRSRSLLTILGIVIGITAIILMMSIGNGAKDLILREIGGLGAEIIVIRPGREPKGPIDIGQTLFSDSLKMRDVAALRKKGNIPALVDVAPAVIVPGSVSFEGETFRPTMFGWSSEFMAEMFNLYPENGALFDESDIREQASVAVIGSKVKQELFGSSDAIGQYIRIKDRKFKVVGVLPERGQVAFFNVNELVILPYTTAQTYLLGIDHFHEIMVKAQSPEAVQKTVEDIKLTLRESHGITDSDKDDFFVVTQQGVVDQVSTIIGALTAFLSSVVAIALVVGGIGVMNVMLVSVTERTREIGLRKALGATNHNILFQFLLEAMMLTGIGGIIGIIFGAIFAFLASLVLTYYIDVAWSFTFPLSAALLGLGVSAIIGLAFGIYPARQAAKKDPIEALRYE